MKKLFVVLAVASLGLVACNNSTSSDETKRIEDSTRMADSTAAAQRAADSAAAAQKMMDTAKPAPIDTAKKK
jgi:uncharacterized lipoprotein NlpE involved in copper resistance